MSNDFRVMKARHQILQTNEFQFRKRLRMFYIKYPSPAWGPRRDHTNWIHLIKRIGKE